MLLYLAQSLAQVYTGFNVFSYLTLRAILASLTALLISLLVGPWMIRTLADRQVGQREHRALPDVARSMNVERLAAFFQNFRDELSRLNARAEARVALARWDESLKADGLNPGTTADLTVTAMLLALITSPRPTR